MFDKDLPTANSPRPSRPTRAFRAAIVARLGCGMLLALLIATPALALQDSKIPTNPLAKGKKSLDTPGLEQDDNGQRRQPDKTIPTVPAGKVIVSLKIPNLNRAVTAGDVVDVVQSTPVAGNAPTSNNTPPVKIAGNITVFNKTGNSNVALIVTKKQSESLTAAQKRAPLTLVLKNKAPAAARRKLKTRGPRPEDSGLHAATGAFNGNATPALEQEPNRRSGNVRPQAPGLTPSGQPNQQMVDDINEIRRRVGGGVSDTLKDLGDDQKNKSQKMFDDAIGNLARDQAADNTGIQVQDPRKPRNQGNARPRNNANLRNTNSKTKTDYATALRESARKLELIAADLEDVGSFEEADELRKQAHDLRLKARKKPTPPKK